MRGNEKMNNSKMLCPCCKTELVVTGQARLETLDEHVSCVEPSMKDKYECPNSCCEAFQEIFWNSDGERYSKAYGKKVHFIDNNDAPFGSFTRRINVEIYKKDEEKDLFQIGRYKYRLVYQYKADDNGKILSRKRKIEIWIEGQNRNGSYTYYHSGIRMLFFSIGQFHRELKWRSNKDLKDRLDKDNWRNKDEWWRVATCWYARTYLKLFPLKEESSQPSLTSFKGML